MSEPEHWRPVPGYEGIYEVSDHGRVKSLPRPTVKAARILAPMPDSAGYFAVFLRKPGTPVGRFRVHAVVLLAFVGPRPDGVRSIRHLDGNKLNDALNNLIYGHPQPATLDDLVSRRRITDSGCWEWTGPTCSEGYGSIRWNGQKTRVHRVVTHLVHGLDLNDPYQYARHKCDNPPCFNPDHLEPGSPMENQQDAIRRARRIRSHCKRGHPLAGDNVFYLRDGRGCRTCRRAGQRAWVDRQQAKAARLAVS